MKFILTIGLLAVAILAHHEHDHDESHACAQKLYKLEEGKIACMAIVPFWYHDHSDGLCKESTFDGCNKNGNNFASEAECKKICDDWHQLHKDHHYGHSHNHEDCKHDHDHSHDSHDHSHDGHVHPELVQH